MALTPEDKKEIVEITKNVELMFEKMVTRLETSISKLFDNQANLLDTINKNALNSSDNNGLTKAEIATLKAQVFVVMGFFTAILTALISTVARGK